MWSISSQPQTFLGSLFSHVSNLKYAKWLHSLGIYEHNNLCVACYQGKWEIARWLWEHDENINPFLKFTAFTITCEGNNLDMVVWMYDRIKDLPDIEGFFAKAVYQGFINSCEGDLECVQFMYGKLQENYDQEKVNQAVLRGFELTCKCGGIRLSVHKWLLPKLPKSVSLNDTCFVLACRRSDSMPLVEWLYEVAPEKTVGDNAALNAALSRGNVSVAQWLRDRGLGDVDESTIRAVCDEKYNMSGVEWILRCTNGFEELLFRGACENSRLDIIEYMDDQLNWKIMIPIPWKSIFMNVDKNSEEFLEYLLRTNRVRKEDIPDMVPVTLFPVKETNSDIELAGWLCIVLSMEFTIEVVGDEQVIVFSKEDS